MAGRYLFLCLALIFSHANGLTRIQTVNGRIKITMGTASGCSNAHNFIRNHLEPTYALYRDYMDVEFVTWGRTVWHPDGSMNCQFGPNDCWANRLHRCAQNMLRGNTDALVRYMACELAPPFPAFWQRSFECVQRVGLDVASADFCQRNPQLDGLDRSAQAAAAEPMRVINWVPFVVFNDNVHLQASRDAHVGFRRMICQALMDDPNIPIRSC